MVNIWQLLDVFGSQVVYDLLRKLFNHPLGGTTGGSLAPDGLLGSNVMFDPSMVNNLGKDLHCKAAYGKHDMEKMSRLAMMPDFWKENCPQPWNNHTWLADVWPHKVRYNEWPMENAIK